MNEPRWHVIASTGVSNFIGEKHIAEKFAKEWDYQFPKSAPHRAVQLVDAAELQQANILIEQQAKQIDALNERLVQCGGKYSDDVYNLKA